MKTSEVLALAAQKQAEHGHCTGHWASPDGQVCLQGAIRLAAGGKMVHDVRTEKTWDGRGTYQIEVHDIVDFDGDVYKAADDIVLELIRRDDLLEYREDPDLEDCEVEDLYDCVDTYAYNDREGTSGEDVILLLKRAAEYAREKEEASDEDK